MLKIKQAFKLVRQTILPVLVAGLMWFVSLPAATSAQANPANSQGQGQELSKVGTRPYGENGGVEIKQVDAPQNHNANAHTAGNVPNVSGANENTMPSRTNQSSEPYNTGNARYQSEQDQHSNNDGGGFLNSKR